MSIFRRKKTQPEEKPITLSEKVIRALNYTPMDYYYTPGFISNQAEALVEARRDVGKIPEVDCYISDYRDSIIDADVRCEISSGKNQYILHISSISVILSEVEDEKIKSLSIRDMLERAIKENESEYKYYMSLLER